MTVEEMKARVDEIGRIESDLRHERDRLRLAIEEAEGRGDSFDARFARAAIAGDLAAMMTLCAESEAAYHRKWGAFPQQDIRDEAMRLLASGSGPREVGASD